jgi:hypothetical protein
MRTDNFDVILEILEKIRDQLNEEYVVWSRFNADSLNMTIPHWNRIMAMLADEGLIKGYEYMNKNGGFNVRNIRITLKGLCYLRDNGR